MIELRKEDYRLAISMLEQSEQPHVFAYSVVDQIQPGKVYVDRISAPASCLILSDSGKYLIAGNGADHLFVQALVTFLNNPDLHKGYYDLYVSSPHWLDLLLANLNWRAVKLKRTRYMYNREATSPLILGQELEDRFRVTEIDRLLFAKYQSELDPSYKALWKSPEQFFANGFGYCVMLEGEIASACNMFYRGAHYAEIDIVTLQAYRNLGLAQAACAAFLERCRQDGLTPVWDCDAGNTPSNRLAARIGFQPTGTYEMLGWHSDAKVMENYRKH